MNHRGVLISSVLAGGWLAGAGALAAGPERYRMWVAYLAGVTVGFEYGPLHVFQTVATKQGEALSPLPPTREDLYREVAPSSGNQPQREIVPG